MLAVGVFTLVEVDAEDVGIAIPGYLVDSRVDGAGGFGGAVFCDECNDAEVFGAGGFGG